MKQDTAQTRAWGAPGKLHAVPQGKATPLFPLGGESGARERSHRTWPGAPTGEPSREAPFSPAAASFAATSPPAAC